MIKYGGEKLHRELCKQIIEIWEEERELEAMLIPIYKMETKLCVTITEVRRKLNIGGYTQNAFSETTTVFSEIIDP